MIERDDKTEMERPGVGDGRLIDLFGAPEPDVPQGIGKHGRHDVGEVEAAGDPGDPVLRRVIGDGERHLG